MTALFYDFFFVLDSATFREFSKVLSSQQIKRKLCMKKTA